MERYVNQTSKGSIKGPRAGEKIIAIKDDGGTIIPQPKQWVPNLICVVNNGFFGAAGYCDTPEEFRVFADPTDERNKTWMLWNGVEKYAQ